MKKVMLFSLLLIIGLIGSQILPDLLAKSYKPVSEIIKALTLVALSFIMIHVGYEFDIQKDKLKS